MPGDQLALILLSKQGRLAVAPRGRPEPGPGEVLIKVQAAALNPSDAKIAKLGIFVEHYPAVLGSDGAGVVEEVGEGVTTFAVGDRIFCHGAFDDNDLATFQQYTVAVADFAAKIPRGISFDEASTIPLGIGTAAIGLYGTVHGIGLVAPWEQGGQGKYARSPIMIFGGSGSVGNFVIQLAKLSGFSPIITTSNMRHSDFLRSIGATHVVDRYLSLSALRAAVGRITSAPINVVYDTISIRDTQKAAWDLLAPTGKLVLTLPSLIEKEAGDRREIVLTNGSPHRAPNRETGRELWANMERWVEEGHIVPNHVETLPHGLDGIIDGLERLYTGHVDGVKLVAHPQES
ncbi:GroES-like protein [Leucogyrophana mollusca]|uniref:GroES-like protein n=1 Tax=Leucogyrophana mollusca TaxID=85980 RepID=A0ACB8B7A4_9AGAM|nr:GroES-like protein [Leucogyrophana mollusca]